MGLIMCNSGLSRVSDGVAILFSTSTESLEYISFLFCNFSLTPRRLGSFLAYGCTIPICTPEG